MVRAYTPSRGDVVWVDFDPQAGHEQAGRRPALVLSPKAYNQHTGRAIVCPITSKVKGWPYEVVLPEGLKVSGAVLADHAKNLDMKARNAALACKVPASVLADVVELIGCLIDGD